LGSSEEILGRALKDYADRDAVVIATKLRHPMRSGANGKGLSRKAIITEVEHSLRRLGTDYIDLYQTHRNDPSTPLEETLEALSDLVTQGKVRYLGASSMPAWELSRALHLQKAHGWHRFVSLQNHYNLLAREEEREMIPLCAFEGVGTLVWSPLARGRLARAWEDAKATARAETDGGYADLLYVSADSDRKIVDAVGAVAAEHGVPRAQIALAWLRSKPVVTAPLVGASSTAQIDDAIASLDVELTGEQVERLEAPYTPRVDWTGISDDKQLAAIAARIPQMTTD
jgi:aryl-alcohol dehydrogenase-like predicted oxidoreductase